MAAEDRTGPEAAQTAQSKTKIDLLLDLIRSKGKTELSVLANNLSVSSNIVENWAKLLEQNNMVRISYEVGKMYVEPMKVSPEQFKMEVAAVDVKKSVLQQALAEQTIDLTNFSHIIENLGRSATSAEALYKQKLPEIQSMVLEINRINEEVVQSYKEMDNIKQKARSEFDSMSHELQDTVTKIGAIDSEAARRSIGESISKIEEAVKSANDTVSTVDGITRDKEAELEGARKDFEQKVAKINKGINDAIKKINVDMDERRGRIAETAQHLKEEEDVVRKTALELKSFEKKRTVGVMRLEELIKEFRDRHSKIQSSIDKRMELLAANMEKIQARIGEIKAGFGDASSVIDSISAAKKSVDTLTEQINSSKSDLAKISSRLDGLANLQKMSVEQRVETVGSLEANLKASGEKIKSIKKEVKQTSDILGGLGRKAPSDQNTK